MGKPESLGSGEATYRFPEEGSPVSIYVSDTGWTVVWTGWNELILIARDGTQKAELSVLYDGLSRSDRKQYVQETTAGPSWAGNSHWHFAAGNGTEHFCIRTWWDQRVVVDLAGGRFVKADRALRKTLESHERAFVLRTLQDAVDNMDAISKPHPEHDCDLVHAMSTAVHMAGRMQIREAIHLLRKLEVVDYIGSSTSSSSWEYKAPDGKVSPNSWEVFSIRRPIQLALRRLGEKASPIPSTRFEVNVPLVQEEGEDPLSDAAIERWMKSRKPYLRKAGQPDPEQMTDRVRKGMTPEEVIDLIDAPDYINSSDEAWEYDIDTDDPSTLVVYWGKGGVKKVKRHKPYWRDGNRRYQDD
jgi:hypothetical protein